MRILFVTSRSPFSPTRGDTLRAYHQIRLLSQRHDLTLVAPLNGDSVRAREPAAWEFRCDTVDLRWSRTAGLVQLLRAPFSALPIQVLYVYPPDTSSVVSRLVSTRRFDLVHIQLVRMGPVADVVDVPCVLDYQDAFSLNAERRARLGPGWWSYALRIEAARVRRYERELSRKVTFGTVTSADDMNAMGNPSNCVVIPNGVDLDAFRFRQHRPACSEIVFTGRMSYYPNADAAEWFATGILPRIRATVPDARFVIAGADPPQRVRRLSGLPGVTVTGYVRSIYDPLAGAAVAVAPLRCATGIQNKVLEAMATGTPVVSTPDAVRGIEVTSGRHLMVAQTEEEFAAHVRRLLQDRSFADRMARQARALVESRHTWEHSVKALEQLYDAAVNRAVVPAAAGPRRLAADQEFEPIGAGSGSR